MNKNIGYAIALALALAAPFYGYPVFLMKVLCFALFACAFNLLIGFTGLLSFGHAAFFGSAGYVAGYALSTLGWPVEAIIGRPFTDFVIADDQTASVGALGDAARGPLPIFENRYRHQDGSIRWISWVAAPAGDAIYASGRDVTEDKANRVELERAQAQVQEAAYLVRSVSGLPALALQQQNCLCSARVWRVVFSPLARAALAVRRQTKTGCRRRGCS